MIERFKDDDIGKLVQIEIDPASDPIAKALGADYVEVRGEIIGLTEEYVRIRTINPRPIMILPLKRKIKDIAYEHILRYEFKK